MNEFTMIREHGPAPTPLSDGVLAKARADLLAEIHATTPTAAPTATGRPVRPRRRAAVVAAAVVAVAVVTGVIATGSTDTPIPPSPTYKAPVLVQFHMPALPPELDPVPDGVTEPGFTAEPGWLAAVYSDADDKPGEEMSAIYVIASSNRPRSVGVQTTYAGKPAVLETWVPQIGVLASP